MSEQSLGPIVADIEGLRICARDRKILRHPALGGICLFSRNYENTAQLSSLCTAIRDEASRQVVIFVDQEGGRIQRFREGFTALPSARQIGELYDADAEKGLRAARLVGLLMASELIRFGVDMSFAPVADLDFGRSEIIGNRSFHAIPDVTAVLCCHFMQGMHDAGMASVAKHFPGHGYVRADSHLEVPEDVRAFDTLAQQDLVPFRAMIAAGVDAIMTAHIAYSKIDQNLPTYSEWWLKTVLRKQLGFTGVVFSDDLIMSGAASAGTPIERALTSLQAGCDALLVCNDPDAALSVMDAVPTGQGGLARLAHGDALADVGELVEARGICASLARV